MGETNGLVGQCLDAMLSAAQAQQDTLDRVSGSNHGADLVQTLQTATAVDYALPVGELLAGAGVQAAQAAQTTSGALVALMLISWGNTFPDETVSRSQIRSALARGQKLVRVTAVSMSRSNDHPIAHTYNAFESAFRQALADNASIGSAWQRAIPAATAQVGDEHPTAFALSVMLQSVGTILERHCD